jgi:hypothetical protein
MTPDETTTEEKSSRSYWGIVYWPVSFVVLYVLSTGPMLLAVTKGWASKNALVAYAPLEEIIRGNFLERPMRIYLHFWVPGMFDSHGDEI